MSRYVERARVSYANREFFVLERARLRMMEGVLSSCQNDQIRMIRIVVRDTDNVSKRTLFADYPRLDQVLEWLRIAGEAVPS